MKKVITLVMCAVMCLSAAAFAGCKPNGEGDYVFTIAYDNGGYGKEWLESAVEKFCAKEGIDRSKVLIEAEKGITAALETRLDSDTLIRDLCITEESTQRKWAAQGYLEPLDDVFKMTLSSGKTVESVLQDGYKDMGYLNNVNGEHYYLFPFTQGAGGIYYNKTLFEEKKWEVPTTYDGLLALCKQIYDEEVRDQPDADKRIYPFVCSQDISAYWDLVVENWWVQLMGIDNFREFCKFESAEIFNPESVYGRAKIEALQAFANLILDENGEDKGWVVVNSSDYNAAQMLFCQGRAAMIPNGAWLENEMKASIPEGVEIAIMPTPFLENAKKDGDEYITVNFNCSANSMFIPSSAAHKDIAKKFIAFLSEEEMVNEFVQFTGSPRPFKYDIKATENLTACQQSVIELWGRAQNFTFMTTSKLSVIGRAMVWMKGYPYGPMIFKDSDGNRVSAEQYVEEEYAFCSTEWPNWISDAEL